MDVSEEAFEEVKTRKWMDDESYATGLAVLLDVGNELRKTPADAGLSAEELEYCLSGAQVLFGRLKEILDKGSGTTSQAIQLMSAVLGAFAAAAREDLQRMVLAAQLGNVSKQLVLLSQINSLTKAIFGEDLHNMYKKHSPTKPTSH